MAALTLKNVLDELLVRLRRLAAEQRRSLSQQTIYVLEDALAGRPPLATQQEREAGAQTDEWRRLAGGWRSTEPFPKEVARVYSARTRGRKVRL